MTQSVGATIEKKGGKEAKERMKLFNIHSNHYSSLQNKSPRNMQSYLCLEGDYNQDTMQREP
jgi:hypothetical protein